MIGMSKPKKHNLEVENLLRLVRDHKKYCHENHPKGDCNISLMIVKRSVIDLMDAGDQLTDEEAGLFL